jgi:hypothetical protein
MIMHEQEISNRSQLHEAANVLLVEQQRGRKAGTL